MAYISPLSKSKGKKGKKGPCWKNYMMVGTKKKSGRTVPNCVPKKGKKKK
jgi:hypothetical protein